VYSIATSSQSKIAYVGTDNGVFYLQSTADEDDKLVQVPESSAMNVYALDANATALYAVTAKGVYKNVINKDGSYNGWVLDNTGLPSTSIDSISSIKVVANNVYVVINSETYVSINGSAWIAFNPELTDVQSSVLFPVANADDTTAALWLGTNQGLFAATVADNTK
jgi:ligand-binding sensor domain-containing protein